VDPQTLPQVLHKEISGEKEQEREISLAEIIGLPDFDVSASQSGGQSAGQIDNMSTTQGSGIG
jgi:hypothetical protein